MAESEPIAEKLSSPGGTPLTALTWADVRTRLTDSGDYLLATSSADGRVHTVPVLGVWLEGTVCFATRRQTRKARDLAENDNCAITAPGHDVDLVVEGTAKLVRDAAGLQRVADLFPTKYPWCQGGRVPRSSRHLPERSSARLRGRADGGVRIRQGGRLQRNPLALLDQPHPSAIPHPLDAIDPHQPT